MSAAKKPAHWLDIIPADLPHERLLPIINLTNGPPGRRSHITNRGKDWRIDLNEPAGFGFALRLLVQRTRRAGGPFHPLFLVRPEAGDRDTGKTWALLVHRHLLGETTDDDRIALARALAQVKS